MLLLKSIALGMVGALLLAYAPLAGFAVSLLVMVLISGKAGN
jgi:hypothetical protein